VQCYPRRVHIQSIFLYSPCIFQIHKPGLEDSSCLCSGKLVWLDAAVASLPEIRETTVL